MLGPGYETSGKGEKGEEKLDRIYRIAKIIVF
jgi:hypothetical protein